MYRPTAVLLYHLSVSRAYMYSNHVAQYFTHTKCCTPSRPMNGTVTHSATITFRHLTVTFFDKLSISHTVSILLHELLLTHKFTMTVIVTSMSMLSVPLVILASPCPLHHDLWPHDLWHQKVSRFHTAYDSSVDMITIYLWTTNTVMHLLICHILCNTGV